MEQSLNINPRKWWHFSRKLFGIPEPTIPSMIVNGQVVTSDEEKANSFNSFFLEASTLDETNAILPDNYPLLCEATLANLHIKEVNTVKCPINLVALMGLVPGFLRKVQLN